MVDFIPGLLLSASFHEAVVGPILTRRFPQLEYSAARLGWGSDVLGFDTEMSTDHGWGPQCIVFLREADRESVGRAVERCLDDEVPATFRGHATRFEIGDPPARLWIVVTTLSEFTEDHLGVAIPPAPDYLDWLVMPQQRLHSTIAGAVFRDDVGLGALRARLTFYPEEVWLYLLASEWSRISQEEHLVARAGYVGDELGARVLAASLVRSLMRLCFLMERRYAPYPKWFGSAFGRLACAAECHPLFGAVLASEGWQARDRALIPAYEAVARMHNRLNLTAPMPETVCQFWERPFHVIAQHGFAQALTDRVSSPEGRRMLARRAIGGVDTWTSSTDLLESVALRRQAVRGLYEDAADDHRKMRRLTPA